MMFKTEELLSKTHTSRKDTFNIHGEMEWKEAMRREEQATSK